MADNRGYSRSQWGHLSIQERIKAMNQNLDASLDPTKNNNSTESALLTIPKRNKSVVDIWNQTTNNQRNNNNNNNGTGKSAAATSHKKKSSQPPAPASPVPEMKRPTIASASPTPPKIPRQKADAAPPDITVIPSAATAPNNNNNTQTSRIKNVSQMWEQTMAGGTTTTTLPVVQKPKRPSVVDVWNRQRNDSMDEKEGDAANTTKLNRFASKSFDTEDEEVVAHTTTTSPTQTMSKQPTIVDQNNNNKHDSSIQNRWSLLDQPPKIKPPPMKQAPTWLVSRQKTSLETTGKQQLAPSNSWIDPKKNMAGKESASSSSPKPNTVASRFGSTTNEGPLSPFSMSSSSIHSGRPPVVTRSQSGGSVWMEKSRHRQTTNKWTPPPPPPQGGDMESTTRPVKEASSFDAVLSTKNAGSSWADFDEPTPASEQQQSPTIETSGRAASLRNLFETQTVQPKVRRWTKPITTRATKESNKHGWSESQPVSLPLPKQQQQESESTNNEPTTTSAATEESPRKSPWPTLRKTGSAKHLFQPGPALPNLEGPEETTTAEKEPAEESVSKPAIPPVRRKVTDRYMPHAVPRVVDTAVSDLVKQHASRTPVGKSRPSASRESIDDPPIVVMPEDDDETDEAFHQMIIENNRIDLDDKKAVGGRLKHLEPAIPVKVDQSVSDLVKKHAVRTPSGKTRTKLAGRWNSAKDLEAEGGLEVTPASESQTETETEIREMDPAPTIQETMAVPSRGSPDLPRPEKRSMAADRWQKRLAKKAEEGVKSNTMRSDPLTNPPSPGGSVVDRWTKRVLSPSEQKSESFDFVTAKVAAKSSKDDSVAGLSASSSKGANDRNENEASATPPKASQGKKKNVMQLGRRHAANRFSAPEKEEPQNEDHIETTDSGPRSPSELIRTLNASSSRGSSSRSSPLPGKSNSSEEKSPLRRKTGIPNYSPGRSSTKASRSAKDVASKSTEEPEKSSVTSGGTSAITRRIAKERLFSRKRLQSQRRRMAGPANDGGQALERKSRIPPPTTSSNLAAHLSKSTSDSLEKAPSDFSLPSEIGEIRSTGSTLSASSFANRAEKVLQRRRRKGAEPLAEKKKAPIQPQAEENVVENRVEDNFDDYYDGQDQTSEALFKIQKSLDETPFVNTPTGAGRRPHGGFEDPSFDEQDSLVQESHDDSRRLTTRYNSATRFLDEAAETARGAPYGGGESFESSLLSHDSITTGSFARYDDRGNQPRQRYGNKKQGQTDREDRSVNTRASNQSAWDPTNLDMSSLVSSIDFKKIATAVDEQVSALRDLVGQQVTPRGTQQSNGARLSAESLEVEDVAIEVEYLPEYTEDGTLEAEAGSDLGVCVSPKNEKDQQSQENNAQTESNMLPGEPSFEQQPQRRAYV